MRFFCYGRKSVFSDKSDSVDNQQRMCRDYVNAKFPGDVESFICFSDEDFSGANTDRPGLKSMMARVRAGECDALVVYQLDRLSRNVRDFSNLYAELDQLSVKFISLKENIDTATPIGCERCVSLQDISEGTMNSAFQAGVNFASIGSVDPETCKDYGSALIVAASAAKNFKYNGYKIIFGKEA